jgi:hypothetical protein
MQTINKTSNSPVNSRILNEATDKSRGFSNVSGSPVNSRNINKATDKRNNIAGAKV